jgi:hypothetical protein
VLRPGASTEPPHGFADSGTDLQSAAQPAPAATGARAVTTCGASHQAPRPGVSDPTNALRPPLSWWPRRYAATSIRRERSPVMGPRRRTRRPDSQRVRCKRRADPASSRAGTDRRWLCPSSGSRLTPAKQAPLVLPEGDIAKAGDTLETLSHPTVRPPRPHSCHYLSSRCRDAPAPVCQSRRGWHAGCGVDAESVTQPVDVFLAVTAQPVGVDLP